MKIVIDAIDQASCKLCGYTQLPGFVVHFHGSAVKGAARLVPASGVADAVPGDEFVVELANESVTDFALINGIVQPTVEPMSVLGDFKVSGAICFLSNTTSGAIQVAQVAVADATFALTLDQIGGASPNIGTTVEFVVHDVSMWDEVI